MKGVENVGKRTSSDPIETDYCDRSPSDVLHVSLRDT